MLDVEPASGRSRTKTPAPEENGKAHTNGHVPSSLPMDDGAFFEPHGFRPVAQDEVPASKWDDYDAARRERARCFRYDLR